MQKILVAVVLGGMLLLVAAFAFFSGIYLLRDREDKPMRAFMFFVGTVTLVILVICVYAVLSS